MDTGLDGIIGLDTLDLKYEAHLAGIDGENFTYSVYFENGVTDEAFEAVKTAVTSFAERYEANDIYLGYIDISKTDENVCIYLDLGNTGAEHQNTAIQGILTALNDTAGISSVIINEDAGFDF